MKDIRKYLAATLATMVLVTVASSPSLAYMNNTNNFSVPHKKFGVQHKKPQISAHHIVTGPYRKNNDFSNLNH